MDIFNNPVVYFEGLAYLMSQGGQNPGPQMLKKAETKFKEALDIHPYHMMSMEKLAVVHQFHGNYAAASTLYSDILSFSPRNLQAALGLMESSRAEGDLHTAMIALEKIDLKYTPANNGALRNQGVATLQAFARSNNPRKVFADLHQNLQGKGQKQMWDTWVSWRVKRRELAQKQANAK
jgi:tetratricopeptide (TPR) repeat protein